MLILLVGAIGIAIALRRGMGRRSFAGRGRGQASPIPVPAQHPPLRQTSSSEHSDSDNLDANGRPRRPHGLGQSSAPEGESHDTGLDDTSVRRVDDCRTQVEQRPETLALQQRTHSDCHAVDKSTNSTWQSTMSAAHASHDTSPSTTATPSTLPVATSPSPQVSSLQSASASSHNTPSGSLPTSNLPIVSLSPPFSQSLPLEPSSEDGGELLPSSPSSTSPSQAFRPLTLPPFTPFIITLPLDPSPSLKIGEYRPDADSPITSTNTTPSNRQFPLGPSAAAQSYLASHVSGTHESSSSPSQQRSDHISPPPTNILLPEVSSPQHSELSDLDLGSDTVCLQFPKQ